MGIVRASQTVWKWDLLFANVGQGNLCRTGAIVHMFPKEHHLLEGTKGTGKSGDLSESSGNLQWGKDTAPSSAPTPADLPCREIEMPLGNFNAKCSPPPGEKAPHRSCLVSCRFPVIPFPGSSADTWHSIVGSYQAPLWQAEWEVTDGI